MKTSLHESLYLENNFSSISSPKAQLLAIHGLGTYGGWFGNLKQILTNKKISLTTVDLPGFGRSGTRGEVKSYKSWIEATEKAYQQMSSVSANQFGAEKNLFLLGHSLGSIVVTTSLKKLNPKPKGIILTAPAFAANPKTYKPFEFMLPTLIKALMNYPEKISYPFPNEIFEAVKKGLHPLALLTSEVKPNLFLEILKLTIAAWQNFANFNEIPLLMVLAGKDDSCVNEASNLFLSICNSPNKTCKTYPKARHDLFILPEAEELNALIGKWIEEKAQSNSL